MELATTLRHFKPYKPSYFVFCLGSLLLFGIISALAKTPKYVKVTGAQGYAIGTTSNSFDQLYQQALNEAKLNALSKAGITEHVTSLEIFMKEERNNHYQDFFTSDVFLQVTGAILKIKIIETKRSFDEKTLQLRVDITINAEVEHIKNGPDPDFQLFLSASTPNIWMNPL